MPQKPSQASQAYRDGHAYIPPHVQEAMTKQVEHMSPSHMKQYAGAYVQQQMVQGRAAPNSGKVSGPPAGYRPVTHLPRKDHFHQYKVQQPSKADTFAPYDQTPSTQIQPQAVQQPPAQMPAQTAYPEQQPTPGPHANTAPDYDFFMSAQEPVQKKTLLPSGGASRAIRIGLVAGGLIVLLIIFNIVKGLLSGPSNFPYYLSVVQDQQAIVHLTENALEEEDLSTAHKNFAATSQASVYSAQSDVVKLLATNNKKVDPKQANLKVSTTIDERLVSAASGGTYNSTFNEVMQAQLKAYMNDLNTTYDKTTSETSRKLLKDQYAQAELLAQQLASASTVASQ